MLDVLRKEVKYTVSIVDFYAARPMLSAVLDEDAHCEGGGSYGVYSLYFDSADDSDLKDVLSGLVSKQKVRLRAYSPTAESFKLEYKCKTGTDSRKYSIPLSRAEALSMAAGRYELLMEREESVAKELYGRMKAGGYQPRVAVRYDRAAYTARLNDVRVTFDSNVSASFDTEAIFDEGAFFQPVTPPDVYVLEVKYNDFLPAYVKTLIERMNLSPVANSKYAQSRLVF